MVGGWSDKTKVILNSTQFKFKLKLKLELSLAKTRNLRTSKAGTRNVKKPKTVENKPDQNMIKNMQKF